MGMLKTVQSTRHRRCRSPFTSEVALHGRSRRSPVRAARRGSLRPIRPPLETENSQDESRLPSPADSPLLPGTCHRGDNPRGRTGVVPLSPRDARGREPLGADPVGDHAAGGSLGSPARGQQPLQGHPALPAGTLGTLLVSRGIPPPRRSPGASRRRSSVPRSGRAAACPDRVPQGVVKLPPARRSGSVRGSNGGLCLRRLGREVAAGGVKRPFAHWCAVAAPDVKPGPNHFVASVTDGAGFPRPRSREWDFEHGSSPLATEMKPGRMFHGAQVSKKPSASGW